MGQHGDAVDVRLVEPGMDLCSSDFQRWGEVSEVVLGDAGRAVIVGTVDATNAVVYVPEGALLEIHGRCLRLNRPQAELDGAGFDRVPVEDG